MKKLLLALLFVGTCSGLNAQVLLSWDFTGSNTGTVAGVENPTPNSFFDATVLTRGAGVLTSSDQPDLFASTGFLAADLASAVTANDFFSFTVTPTAGNRMNLTTIDFLAERDHKNGPTSIEVRYDLNGFGPGDTDGTLVGSVQSFIGNNTTLAGNNLSFGLGGLTVPDGGTATIRIYAYDSQSGDRWVGLGGATDDLILNGTAEAVPEPSTYALIFGGIALGGVLIVKRRAKKEQTA